MSVSASSGGIAVQVFDQPPSGWDELLSSDSGADFFHSPGWSTTASSHYREAKPRWLVAELDGRIAGGLALVQRTGRLPLLGGIDHLESSLEGTSGGPLVSEDLAPVRQVEVFQSLVEAFLGLRRGLVGNNSISLNTHHENRFGHLLRTDPRWRRRDVPGSVIDLSGGLQHVEMTLMKRNKRTERNRGLREGVEVFATNDVQWLDGYYPIYEQASQRWGTPAVPLEFLKDLLRLGPEHTFFNCLKLGDKVIGGHLNVVFGDRVMAWNGVSDPAYARSHFPGTLCIWADVVEACRRGAATLDLGASGGVVTLSGFKKYFGAQMETRGFYVNDSGGMRLLRNARDGWAHLKSFLSPVDKPNRWHDGLAQEQGQPEGRAPGETPAKADSS